MPVTDAATFCATLADEWITQGVAHAVVAPGSRSTPLAVALAARSELSLHVVHDERSAAFMALGVGLASGRPAVVLCTSGTAAAHFHAAVIEASLSGVPMIVCTADRPPELRDVGAPQTIDQTKLYGSAPRWFHDPGVPDRAAAGTWRSLAERSFAAASGTADHHRPGPVHLNLPFREPLVGDADTLPSAGAGRRSMPRRASIELSDEAVAALDRQRGVIVAGHDGGHDRRPLADTVEQLSASTGWPVLAEPRAGFGGRTGLVATFDGLLRSADFARAHVPEVVVRVGEAPASKVLAQWIAASGAREVQVGGGRWLDPDGHVTLRLPGDSPVICRALSTRLRGATGTPWAARWARAEARAQAVLAEMLDEPTGALTDPVVARLVSRSVPTGGHLVVASSMPVRDHEWFGCHRHDVTVHASRGANGIDGTVATAIGVSAATAMPVVVHLGDIALLHDSSSLTGLAARGLDVRIIVTDNDGGAIFSFLPQATSLPADRFEQLFGTPHGTDLAVLAGAHHLAVHQPTDASELGAALRVPGPALTVVSTDRARNVIEHRRLNEAIASRLG